LLTSLFILLLFILLSDLLL